MVREMRTARARDGKDRSREYYLIPNAALGGPTNGDSGDPKFGDAVGLD